MKKHYTHLDNIEASVPPADTRIPTRCGLILDGGYYMDNLVTNPENSDCLTCIALARRDGDFPGDEQFRETAGRFSENNKKRHWLPATNPNSYVDKSRCGHLVDKQDEIYSLDPEDATCSTCRNMAERDGELSVVREKVPESRDRCQYLLVSNGLPLEICKDKDHLQKRINRYMNHVDKESASFEVYRVDPEFVTVKAETVNKVETNIDEVL